METIKKVCNDNNFELKEMGDFLLSLEEFLKNFDPQLDMEALAIHIKISKKAVGLFGRGQREYLDSVLDFIDCFEQTLTIEELQEHLRSALKYLGREV